MMWQVLPLGQSGGLNVDWDLNKVLFSAGYEHENFIPVTTQFDYLNRASEWFTASASLRIATTRKPVWKRKRVGTIMNGKLCSITIGGPGWGRL